MSELREAFQIGLYGVNKNFGKVRALENLTLEIKQGEFLTLLGMSGSGKTTILRLIAGLERVDKGIVKINEQIVDGDQYVPPEKRGVGIVFQDYALFPHMTIFENIAFGLKNSKKDKKERVEELLNLVGLSGMRSRYPHELSGGQQQRVALARALASSPHTILLDEPFSNLDPNLKAELSRQTKRILKEKGTTVLLVTHDQEEALSISDRIGIINEGKIVQLGTPYEIYYRPTNKFVAQFLGKANFIKAKIEDRKLVSDFGVFTINGSSNKLPEYVEMMIRHHDVDFEIDPEGRAEISEVQFLGSNTLYKLSFSGKETIYALKSSHLQYPIGSKVNIKSDIDRAIFFEISKNEGDEAVRI